MSLALRSREDLQRRAQGLAAVRRFFEMRGVMEVDTPLLSPYAPIDPHIDIFRVEDEKGEWRYLHSSPEYAMKKLLASGCGDIYQLGHVFRKGEEGALHAPEFTMIEWYRVGVHFEAFVEESVALCALFLGGVECERLSYRTAFRRALGVEWDGSAKELAAAALRKGIEFGEEDPELLNEVWGCCVEPTLGRGGLSLITHYPASQAALARTNSGVAERFELYFEGVELGNGYHELNEGKEQERRLKEANEKRKRLGKESFALDGELIKAVERLPDCYGMAIGFDRLLLLQD